MKLIRKLYWITAAVMLVAGFPYEGTGEFITTLSYYFFFGVIFLYAAPKVLGIGRSARSGGYHGGLRGSVIGGLQQGTSRAVTNFMMGNGSTTRNSGVNEAALRRQAEDQRARDRYRARNEAIFHENQAKKWAGTYDGYRAANRAQAARNKARNL